MQSRLFITSLYFIIISGVKIFHFHGKTGMMAGVNSRNRPTDKFEPFSRNSPSALPLHHPRKAASLTPGPSQVWWLLFLYKLSGVSKKKDKIF